MTFPTGGDLTEWQECRKTIGRLDTTIADLRKFGFSLVTVLITASSFLGQQVPSFESKMSVSIAIMLLISVLFAIDRYYTLLLNGAVEKALDLEGPKLDFQNLSQDRLTQVISVYAIKSGAVFIVPAFYLVLLWTTLLLASALAGKSSTEVRIAFGLSLAFILIYFIYTEAKSKTGTFSDRRKQQTNQRAT
jgi:hypothetical protein